MPPVTDVTKVVSFPFLPIGYWAAKGNRGTVQEIIKWYQEEKPNFIKRQPLVTVFGAIFTLGGALFGLSGFKTDSKAVKWFGGILALCGVIGSVIGKLMGIDLMTAEETKTQEKNLEEIKKDVIILKDESLRTVPREDALGRLLRERNYPEGVKAVLDFIADSKGDHRTHSLRRLAIPSLINCIKERDKQRFIEILLDRFCDPNENKDVRTSAVAVLGDIADESILEPLNKVLEGEKNFSIEIRTKESIEKIRERTLK